MRTIILGNENYNFRTTYDVPVEKSSWSKIVIVSGSERNA